MIMPTHAELNALAAQKSPSSGLLLYFSELAALRQRLAAGPTTMRAVDAAAGLWPNQVMQPARSQCHVGQFAAGD